MDRPNTPHSSDANEELFYYTNFVLIRNHFVSRYVLINSIPHKSQIQRASPASRNWPEPCEIPRIKEP